MAVLIDIADAAVTAMNSHSFSQAFTATRKHRPRWNLEDMADLHVTVVPADVEMVTVTRHASQQDFGLQIGVQKVVSTTGEDAAVTGLRGLLEEIAEYWLRTKLTSPVAWCVFARIPQGLGEPDFDERRLFTGIVELTFRLLKK